MTKQPIDTTKELKFYTSKIITAGIIILAIVIGFASAKYLFLVNYNSFQIGFVVAGLVLSCCLCGFIWGVYILFVNPLRLCISMDGIYSPETGNLLWSSIKDIEAELIQEEYGEDPVLLKIKLADGKSYKLKSGLFIRIDTRKLLETLRTYHRANKNKLTLT